MWDQRDIELNLREKLAQLIASKISGLPFADPIPEDYSLADALSDLIDAREN